MGSLQETHVTYDVLIIGAGLAGTAMAITQARQGRRVLLIERDLREPDRIVGELLQPGGVASLRKLGLDECLRGIDALPLRGYRLVYYGKDVSLWYPLEKKYPIWGSVRTSTVDSTDEKHGDLNDLPHEGRSLRNGRLVRGLREIAFTEKNITIIESTARKLLWSEDRKTVIGVTTRSRTGEADQIDHHHFAHLTVVADGHASNFRSMLSDKKPISRSKFYSLQLMDTDSATGGMSIGTIGRAWVSATYQLSHNETRILVNVPTDTSGTHDGNLAETIRDTVIPTLPASVQSKAHEVLGEKRMRSMPNSWLPPVQIQTPGVLLLGDAYNIRHPISGSGMTVAMHDTVLLSELLHPSQVPTLQDHALVKRQISDFKQRRRSYTLSLNVMAEMMYLMVTANDDYWRIWQRGFLGYIESSQERMEDLAAITSGIIMTPRTLYYHFAVMAAFSTQLHIRTQYNKSLWGIPWAAAQCVIACGKAIGAALPLVLHEFYV
ncbi:squalene epoxidase-domain-containing protein [Xylaria nigripes]|nr:squalene epoxidase-domain-containing protein [Xylaria nigripes]